MFKRIGTLLLALALCLSLVPQAGLAAQSVIPLDTDLTGWPSEAEVYEAMMTIQEGKYPEGTVWEEGRYHEWSYGYFDGGWGSTAFAYKLNNEAFGYLPDRRYARGSFAYGDIRPGDILWAGEHAVVILEVHEDYVVVAEGGYNDTVHWGRTIAKDQLMSETDELLTRYPDHQHDLYVEGRVEPTETTMGYTGDTYCRICRVRIQDGEDIYYTLGKVPTEAEAYAAMMAMQATYPAGVKCTDEYLENHVFASDDDVPAFLCYVSDAAFGNLPSRTFYKGEIAFGELMVGDILRCGYRNTWFCTFDFIILETHEDHLIVATVANADSGQNNGPVVWDKRLDKDEVEDVLSSVITRYPGQRNTCGSNVTWTLDDNGTLTISGTGDMFDSISSWPNLVSPFRWEADKEKIKTVIVEEGVTSIAGAAFSKCKNLTRVVLPSSLVQIGSKAFYGCRNLKEIIIPDGVEWIGDSAFYDCRRLTSIQLPKSLTSLEDRVFYGCTRLTNVTIPEHVKWNGMEVFYGCTSLSSVTISEGISLIGQSAFSGCTSLTEVQLPESLTQLETGAFYGCTGLTSITIPDGVTEIGSSAFYNCASLAELAIPSGVAEIGDGAFSGCSSLKRMVILEGIPELGDRLFRNCTSLTEVVIPDSVTEIGEDAFDGCTSLTQLRLPEDLRRMSRYAFRGCTSLTELTIPKGVEYVGLYAFYECTALEKVTFLGDLPQFGKDLWNHALVFPDLTLTAYYPKDNPTWTEDVRQNYGGSVTWVAADVQPEEPPVEQPPVEPEQPPVTTDVVASGKAENMTWSLDKNGKLTISGTGDMPYCQMEAEVPWYAYLEQIKSVVIEKGITSVGPYAFRKCWSLEEVSIPQGVTIISKYAFDGCVNLKAVSIPGTVETIGLCAFNMCEKMETLELGNGIREIQNHAFDMCRALTEITIPASITKLENMAFASCDELAVIHFEGNMPQFSGNVFSGSGYLSDIICYYPANDPTWQNMGSYGARLKWVVEGSCLHSNTEIANIKAPTCTEVGYTGDSVCALCGTVLSSGSEIPALGHSFQDGSCTVCGEADPDWKAPEPEPTTEITRLAGAHRFETAFLAANQMKKTLDIEKFDTVVVASGMDFADALSGSYLAAVKNAPILLACDVGWINDLVKEYINSNLNPGGTVYILGGTKAIPDSFKTGLEAFAVTRLAGSNRFLTNLEVLEEAGIGDKPILVATGLNFADCLSASAAKLPILLVYGEKLLDDQAAFLEANKGRELYIIGGTGAVSPRLEASLMGYGTVERLAGSNRFETSVLIAREFFDSPQSAVLAYAWDFPDGLCGGSLAATMNAPLILTMEKYETQATDYIQAKNIRSGFVLGGEKLIPDASANTIFGVK